MPTTLCVRRPAARRHHPPEAVREVSRVTPSDHHPWDLERRAAGSDVGFRAGKPARRLRGHRRLEPDVRRPVRSEKRSAVHRARSTRVGHGAVNQALAATRAPFVHLLASGCTVIDGWADEAISPLRRSSARLRRAAGVDSPDCDRLLAAGIGYRIGGRRFWSIVAATALSASSTIIGPASFAAFYRKAALDFIGGLSTQLGPRQADADLALALERAGFRTALAPKSPHRGLARRGRRRRRLERSCSEKSGSFGATCATGRHEIARRARPARRRRIAGQRRPPAIRSAIRSAAPRQRPIRRLRPPSPRLGRADSPAPSNRRPPTSTCA